MSAIRDEWISEDGSVRLFVFGPKGQHMDDGLTQGDGPCQWNWPKREGDTGLKPHDTVLA